jgi:hypothetical protein
VFLCVWNCPELVNGNCSGATAAAAAQHSKEGHLAVVDNNSTKNLFKGVSIWVDGFTIPSHQVCHSLRHQPELVSPTSPLAIYPDDLKALMNSTALSRNCAI